MNAFLAEANVSEGVRAFSEELRSNPGDDQLRFAVGFMEFAEAVQTLGQSWYRYGLRAQAEYAQRIPFLRFPVPVNPEPEPLSHEAARSVLVRCVNDLSKAESTLAGIKSETVGLGIQLGRAYLDFDADGKGAEPFRRQRRGSG